MALTIETVSIADFRSYDALVVEPDEHLTLLVGPNAAGKTNLVEAIQVTTSAESFRKPQWADLVKRGSSEARVSVEAQGEGRHLTIELKIPSSGRREYRMNGKLRRRVVDVVGVLPSVVFSPDDLRLVKDSAERRRASIDSLGSQVSPAYSTLRANYERVLRQRNALLRTDEATTSELEPWTERLVEFGAALSEARSRLAKRLAEQLASAHDEIAPGTHLEMHYAPSWERDGIAEADSDPDKAIRALLASRAAEERARRTTLVGPHRDDIIFTLDGADARAFGSQGQQRTIALSWKLGEVGVITEISGQPPVLLLDDVMSELDEARRHALARYVGTVAQTIVTTTNTGYFEPALLDRAKVVRLGR